MLLKPALYYSETAFECNGESMRPEDRTLWTLFIKDIQPLKQTGVTCQPTLPVRLPSMTGCRHTLDLHGLMVMEAYARTMAFVAEARDNYKFVTVVTGSGRIREEFAHWLAGHPDVRTVDLLAGGGAFRVYFRRRSG